jgi:hypothetical protein
MREELAWKIQQLLKDDSFQATDELLDKIRTSIILGDKLPPTVDCRKEDDVRQAQRVLAQIEIRLDYIIRVQYRAKRILQTCATAERALVLQLQEEGTLPEKMTKLQRETALYAHAQDLVELQDRWRLVEVLCTDVQKRLAEMKSTVKLQKDLDDNLRWAQRG